MNKDNKFKMFIDLQEWIELGSGVPDMIVDSPYQHPMYAPYVVDQLLKKTPIKHIPGAVFDQLKEELLEEYNELPKRKKKWYQF